MLIDCLRWQEYVRCDEVCYLFIDGTLFFIFILQGYATHGF